MRTSRDNPGYTAGELLAVMTARLLEDNKTVFVGIGMPMVAAGLAQVTRAPSLTVIFEGGIIGPQLKSRLLPLSTQEIRCARKSLALVGTTGIFSIQQRGFLDYGVLGAAQVDAYGNVNTSAIGDYSRPKVRLPGTGGANDIASSNTRVIICVMHEKRRFVEKVDFVTSPGYVAGWDSRARAGLIFGGPFKVVTNLGIMGFDPVSKRMRLESVHQGVTVSDVEENTGFKLDVPPNVTTNGGPTATELEVVRSIDPDGIMLSA